MKELITNMGLVMGCAFGLCMVLMLSAMMVTVISRRLTGWSGNGFKSLFYHGLLEISRELPNDATAMHLIKYLRDCIDSDVVPDSDVFTHYVLNNDREPADALTGTERGERSKPQAVSGWHQRPDVSDWHERRGPAGGKFFSNFDPSEEVQP